MVSQRRKLIDYTKERGAGPVVRAPSAAIEKENNLSTIHKTSKVSVDISHQYYSKNSQSSDIEAAEDDRIEFLFKIPRTTQKKSIKRTPTFDQVINIQEMKRRSQSYTKRRSHCADVTESTEIQSRRHSVDAVGNHRLKQKWSPAA